MNEFTPHGGASPEVLACLLERHRDYRIQRRLRPMTRFGGATRRFGSTLSGCALAVATTGFDHRKHALIELSMQRFRADENGRIIDTGPPFRWLEDPGIAIPKGITVVTGIDAAAVAGRRICDAEATCMMLDADFVVSQNAAFDRPFVDRRLPLAMGRPWICMMQDVDWQARRFEGRVLPYLLRQMGWFYETQRTDSSVNALLHLLDHSSSGEDRTVLAEAIATASRPRWLVEVEAPFEAEGRLNARGYRWNAKRSCWSMEIDGKSLNEEIEWFVVNVHGGSTKPVVRRTDWRQRHAAS